MVVRDRVEDFFVGLDWWLAGIGYHQAVDLGVVGVLLYRVVFDLVVHTLGQGMYWPPCQTSW